VLTGVLLQAHGFHGLGRLAVQLHFDDAATTNGEDDRGVSVHFDSAPAHRAQMVRHDDRLTVVYEIQRLHNHTMV